MAGQRQKHPDSLTFKRGGRYQALAVVEALPNAKPPALPKGTSPEVRRVWRELWRAQLAGAFKPTDVPTLRRWAWWLNQWLRVSAEVEESNLLTFTKKGYALNPAWRALKQCETALRELEKAFGMDALARLRLGITLADGQAKAAALRKPSRPEAI